MDRKTNIVFVLALIAAFALGLSVHADIQTSFNEKTEKLQLVIVEMPVRADPPTEEPAVEPVSKLAVSQILRRLPYTPQNLDGSSLCPVPPYLTLMVLIQATTNTAIASSRNMVYGDCQENIEYDLTPWKTITGQPPVQ